MDGIIQDKKSRLERSQIKVGIYIKNKSPCVLYLGAGWRTPKRVKSKESTTTFWCSNVESPITGAVADTLG